MLDLMKARKQKLTKEEKLQQKLEQREKTSAQQLIPIKSIHNGILRTPDDYLIGSISVSAVNTQLMSDAELEDLLEDYESVLRTIDFEHQQNLVSIPIDLKQYIKSQEELLNNTENEYRRMLLESYIDYTRSLEKSKGIMMRRRYITVTKKLKENTRASYDSAVDDIQLNLKHYKEGLETLELIVEPVGSLEMVKNLHVFFNYSDAVEDPLQTLDVPQIVEGVKVV